MECPICKSKKTEIFLKRYKMPVCQNLLCFSKKAAKVVKRDDTFIAVCKKCGFIFNQCFNPDLLGYGKDYNNSQTSSPVFRDHIDSLIDQLVEKEGVRNRFIVEIGCGDGFFLKALCKKGKNTGIGFDPSYVGPKSLMNGKLRFVRGYYGGSNKFIGGDVIICRHVIEHVKYSLNMLNLIKRACEIDFPHAKIFFETPSAAWILKNRVIWDFFYEHCSYFTKESLKTSFEIAGLKINKISKVFRGQYLWVSSEIAQKKSTKKIKNNSFEIQKLTKRFDASEKKLLKSYLGRIKKMNKEGKVALWGAGAKGVAFANLIDPDCKSIDCVVDLNSKKQGKYIPGTGHPIVDYKQLSKRNVRNVILMNPNYHSENKMLLRKACLHNINLI